MKFTPYFFIALLACSAFSQEHPSESLPTPALDSIPAATPPSAKPPLTFTLNGKTYEEVRDVRVTLETVSFQHRDGVTKLKWVEIPDNLAVELNVKRPGTTEKAKNLLENLTQNETIGLGLWAIGLLISLLGGVSFLKRAWGVSPFWFFVALLPAAVCAFLLHQIVFDFLLTLGFPMGSVLVAILAICFFVLFFGLLSGVAVGYACWAYYSANHALPPVVLLLAFASFLPGALLVFTNTDKMFKALFWQLTGLAAIIGGGVLLSDRLDEWQKTTFHPPAEAARIKSVAP